MREVDFLDAVGKVDARHVEECVMYRPNRAKKWIPLCVAACLCIVLIGTAFAIDEFYNFFSSLLVSEVGPTYELSSTPVRYPMDSFSDALLEASENRGSLAVVKREFDTWEEVRAFIGSTVDIVWPKAESWEGRYHVYLFHTGSNKLWGIRVESLDLYAKTSVSLKIYTEHHIDETVILSTTYTEDTVALMEPYTTAAGFSTELVLIRGPEDHPSVQCVGSFTRMGVIYSVEAYGTLRTQEETVLRLRTLLDNFD